MLNAEEFLCPELRLAMCHVKEAMRTILHSLVVCRSIGGHRPIEPQVVFSELLDVCYLKTDEADFDDALEQAVAHFSEMLESGPSHAGRAQLVVSFYVTKSRKHSIWNILVGADEKVVFEQWRMPVVLQHFRRHASPTDNLREEANLQASASQQVHQAMHWVIGRTNAKVEHLPPPPATHSAYKFDISFAIDGKEFGAAAALRSSLTQTIRHIPHIV